MGIENGGFNPEAEIRANKVEAIKVKLVEANFLRPDEKQKEKISENLGIIFSEQLKHGTKSVMEMDQTMDDFKNNGSTTEIQSKNAEEDKKILGEAVVLAVRELRQDGKVLDRDIYRGSRHMDNMLPTELKGLGREITRGFIGNDEIDKQLNLVEVTRQSVDLNNSASVETLIQKIDMRIKKLSDKDYEDEGDIGEQDTALTMLNTEKKNLMGMVNVLDKKDDLSDRMVAAAEKMAAAAETMGSMEEGRSGGRKKGDARPIYNEEGEIVGYEGETSSWQLTADYAAEAMKYMDSSMRWQSYTPPEWFKKLDGETQARIEYMVMVNNAAAGLLYAGKDLDKILGNKSTFGFKSKQMSRLFNDDFKAVTSKMLNDLCEFYTDQNGHRSLRYKLKDEGGKISMDKNVKSKIERIEDYEDEMAMFLAQENGRSEPNYMDKMNAYTAWNLFFAMGDSSLADTMRILPTYEGIISDAIRTLNPEYKALGKWQVRKSGEAKTDDALIEAEYFGGNTADYLLTIMKMERDLGRPIDGKKTMRDKLLDGNLSFLSNRTFYGFFDFVNGGRDLFEGSDIGSQKKFFDKKKGREEEVSLADLVKGYAFELDENGDPVLGKDGKPKLIDKDKRREFTFGDKQATFMNEFRDSLEGSIMAYNCLTGAEEIKDPVKWIIKFKSKLSMVNGIKFNTRPAFSYSKDPEFWRDILIGSFGYDERRLSSDHICLKKQKNKSATFEPAYNLYLFDLITDKFKISNKDLNINELFRLLGVDLKPGEKPDGFGVTNRNNKIEREERNKTIGLNRQWVEKFNYDEMSGDLQGLVEKVSNLRSVNTFDFNRLKRDFDKAVRLGSSVNAEKLYRAMMKEISKK